MIYADKVIEAAHGVLDALLGKNEQLYISPRSLLSGAFEGFKALAMSLDRWRDADPSATVLERFCGEPDGGYILSRPPVVAEVSVDIKTCRTSGCDNPAHAGTGVCKDCLTDNGQ